MKKVCRNLPFVTPVAGVKQSAKVHGPLVHPSRKKIGDEFNTLNVGGVIIERLYEVKYLGTYLDDQLNWKPHINYLSQKQTKILCAFKLIKNLLPKQYRYQLYHAYHYSQICYGIETYGIVTKSNLNKIQSLQNKIIKVVFNKDWLTPTNDLHRELKILKVEDVHKLFTLRLIYQHQTQIASYL